jgi:hypothetical protein
MPVTTSTALFERETITKLNEPLTDLSVQSGVALM